MKNWLIKYIIGGVVVRDCGLSGIFHVMRFDSYQSLWQRIKNKFKKNKQVITTYSS